MSTDEYLRGLYNGWSDQQLMDAYGNKEDYTESSIVIMEEVLQSRGLLEKAKKIAEFKIQEDVQLAAQSGTVVETQQEDPKETLKRAKRDGVYYEKVVLKGGKANLAGFVFAMSITALVFWGVSIFTEFFDTSTNTIFIICFIVLGVIGINIMKKNKSTVNLYDEGSDIKLTLDLGAEKIDFTFPFKYTCRWQLVEIQAKGVRAKRPNLYIVLHHPDGKKYCLNEDKHAFADRPHDWVHINEDAEPISWDLRLTNHGTKAMELIRLKLVLDKMSEAYA